MECKGHHHNLKSARSHGYKVVPNWPSYTGTSQLVGTSPSGMVTVYVDPTLGAPALKNAQDLLSNADSIVVANANLFGTAGGHVDVIVFALGGAMDGTGGADHMACDYTEGAQIEVDCDFGNSQRVFALFEAELSECSMGGNLCGMSTGEALSRWCAIDVAGNVLTDFASAPVWAQDGMPNWVDKTEPSDQDYDSIGCGMAYISWLIAKENMTLPEIAQRLVKLGDNATLGDLFPVPQNAWSAFQAGITALGGPSMVTSDDPFGARTPAPAPRPAPAPTPTPAPTPAPGPTPVPTPGNPALPLAQAVMNTILVDLSTGVTKQALVADIEATLHAHE